MRAAGQYGVDIDEFGRDIRMKTCLGPSRLVFEQRVRPEEQGHTQARDNRVTSEVRRTLFEVVSVEETEQRPN